MFYAERAELKRAQQLLIGYSGGATSIAAAESSEYRGPFKELFVHAGMNSSQIYGMLAKLAAVEAFVLLLALFISKVQIALIGTGAIFLVAYLRLGGQVAIRRTNFEKDYTALLLSLASSVRTGLDPLVALIKCKDLFSPKSEVAKEIDGLNRNVESGKTEENCLQLFGATIPHADIQLFRTAFILSRKEGASLGMCLERLAKVTRQRQSFRRKVKSAVAMQKMSAFGIGACTVVIGLIQFMANPKGVRDALEHPIGFKLIVLGVGLVLFGIIWMMRMARAKF